MLLALIAASLIALCPAPAQSSGAEPDGDRDGLPDRLEQELLRRFSPTFMLSAGECDEAPAEFLPGSPEPHVVSRNGTVYGQVSPRTLAGRQGVHLEIRYYHLWARDCGRAGHGLDAEHVSALLWAESLDVPATGWSALYWYAAAHQGTACDAGHGARSSALGAEDRGATVWVSAGKHASFLSLDRCRRPGCGGDRCERSRALPPGKLLNLGEAGTPQNGAIWADAGNWRLTAKSSDFGPETLARLEALDGAAIASVGAMPAPLTSVILAGDTALDAAGAGTGEVAGGVSAAGAHTEDAMGRGRTGVTRALGAARRALARWVGPGSRKKRP